VVAGGALLAGAGNGIFTGGEPLSGQGRLTAGDFSEIFQQNWQTFFHWSNVDRAYLAIWDGLHELSRGFGVAISWFERLAVMSIVLLSVLLLVGVRWFVPAVASTETLATPRISPLIIAACAGAAAALILAAAAQGAWRRLVPLMMLASAAAIAGLVVEGPWLRLGLLELAALLTIPLVWQNARTRSAKWLYVTIVALSGLALVAGDLLSERGETGWTHALLLTSICVKLAAFPLIFWLLRLADEIPSLVFGLIIAVIDIAAFGELYVAAQASPGLLSPQGLWLGIGAATSLLAALLMLSQRNLKRLLVLSTIEDVGFLFLGLASASALGTSGMLIAAATHALAKALLFICLSGPEADGALAAEHRGLASNYPVSAFGFLFGMLAMLGVPPTLGYIGRWRLYESALRINPVLLYCFLLSSVFALIAYVLALTRVWWGPAADTDLQFEKPFTPHPSMQVSAAEEPFVLRAVIVALVALLLMGGFWPDALQALSGGRL
jgi:formate hydrogenlyase subunit 3/multisubunit Na+/H+ antiporter MnhD subunit